MTGILPHRVLLVEDVMIVAMTMKTILTDAGYDVLGPLGGFADAHDAASRKVMTAALLDINLHGRMVYPIADILVARNIPFAFLSGYDRENLPERYGDAPLLIKPFRPDQLLDAMTGLIDRLSARVVS